MLEFHNISVAYGQNTILKNISVSFPDHRISVIAGPNGCGKTTLLHSLIGASRITEGTVLLNDGNLLELSSRERAQKLSFLPQVRTVIPSLPVKTFVEHGRFPYLGFYRRKTGKDTALVRQAMEFTRTLSYADQPMDTLSGGIRQRVFFAMVLAQDCEYIILDEPTTYLDIAGQRDFFAMIRTLKAQKKTIVMVLHDLTQAMRIADHLVLMDKGQIAFAGTPNECLDSSVLENVFHVTWKHFTDGGEDYYFFR